jgi:hypothetical protein
MKRCAVTPDTGIWWQLAQQLLLVITFLGIAENASSPDIRIWWQLTQQLLLVITFPGIAKMQVPQISGYGGS